MIDIDFGMEPKHIDDQVMTALIELLNKLGHNAIWKDGVISVDPSSFGDADERTITAFVGHLYVRAGQQLGYELDMT